MGTLWWSRIEEKNTQSKEKWEKPTWNEEEKSFHIEPFRHWQISIFKWKLEQLKEDSAGTKKTLE